jgi:hypothetical protein
MPYERRLLTSSSLAEVAYDSDRRTLEVTFTNGRTYEYSGVPGHVYRSLLSASSHGTYFNEHMRSRYPYRLIG